MCVYCCLGDKEMQHFDLKSCVLFCDDAAYSIWDVQCNHIFIIYKVLDTFGKLYVTYEFHEFDFLTLLA